MSAATKAAIEDFLRGLLAEKLASCTESQRMLFHDRVYPKGVPTDRLEDAIDLCERTLKSNLAAARLYGLKPGQYVVSGPSKADAYREQEGDVHLYPRHHGDYKLPDVPNDK